MAGTFAVLLSGIIAGTPVLPLHAAPQSTHQTLPVFDVASIRPSGPVDVPFTFRIEPDGTTAASGITVKRLLMTAYNLQGFRIVGGPAWVDSQQWELKARHEGVVTPEQLRQMLVTLMVARFQLRTHRETRNGPVYHLVLDRSGSKLPSTNNTNATPEVRVAPGSLHLASATPATFASQLSYAVARPVIDKTNLNGRFDFSVEWTPFAGEDGGPAASGLPPGTNDVRPAHSEGVSIFTALQEQLGLKLEPAKGPVDVLVIDHVERPRAD